MCMEVICHRYFAVPKRRSYETDAERRMGLLRWHRRRGRHYIRKKGSEDAGCKAAEVDKEW